MNRSDDPSRRQPKVTINDVARLAGVSKKTVSRVINRSEDLNIFTRHRVEQVINRTGYVPNPQARSLALRRNFTIGLVYDETHAQSVPDAQRGIADALRNSEFELLVCPVFRHARDFPDRVAAFLHRQRPFGIIVLPPIERDDEIVGLCAGIGCKDLWIGPPLTERSHGILVSSDYPAVLEAVRLLAANGHHRIGLMAASGRSSPSSAVPAMNLRTAVAAAGTDPGCLVSADGDGSFESGLLAAGTLLDQRPRPTAILAATEDMAAGCFRAAALRDIAIPGDLSVIALGSSMLASRLSPGLSAIRWPLAAMARAAAVRLTGSDELQDDDRTLFASVFVDRGSVGPVPAGVCRDKPV